MEITDNNERKLSFFWKERNLKMKWKEEDKRREELMDGDCQEG